MKMRIDAIQVGTRRREDYGDLSGLTESIQHYGLIHPIVVDDDGRLIAGGRRLEACRSLGLAEVEVRSYGSLSPTERREIELEENLWRKDLNSYERDRNIVDLVETAREAAREEIDDLRGTLPRKSGRGRPAEVGSFRDVEQRTGIPARTIQRAEQRVAAVERYPELRDPSVGAQDAVKIARALDKLPEDERPLATRLISAPAIPGPTATEMLTNLAAMPEPDRKEVFDLMQSEDARDQSLAKTRAAGQPASPDPRWVRLDKVLRDLRDCARMFPKDPFTPRLKEVVALVAAIRTGMEEAKKQ